MTHRGVGLAVCLLAICAAVLETGSYINRNRRAAARERSKQLDRYGHVARMDADFIPGRHQHAQVPDKRPGAAAQAKHDLAPVFFREPETWFADNRQWMSPGNKMWQDFYISSSDPNKATIGSTAGKFSIDGNSGTTPPIDWAGNIVPFGGGNFSQYPVGGSYPSILAGNSSGAGYLAPQANASASNGSSATANPSAKANTVVATDSPSATTNLPSAENLSASNAMEGNLESAGSATRMEESSLLSAAAMDTVTDIYQAADGMLLAEAGPGRFNSGETDTQDVKNRIVARTGGISSGNSTPVVWISNANGRTVQATIDSAPQGPANPTINQGWAPNQGQAPGAGWSVVTADETWGVQSQNSVPWQEVLIDNPAQHSFPVPVAESSPDPPPRSTPNPVPEPSQMALMVTVIALAALGAKRSAVKRRIAAHPGR